MPTAPRPSATVQIRPPASVIVRQARGRAMPCPPRHGSNVSGEPDTRAARSSSQPSRNRASFPSSRTETHTGSVRVDRRTAHKTTTTDCTRRSRWALLIVPDRSDGTTNVSGEHRAAHASVTWPTSSAAPKVKIGPDVDAGSATNAAASSQRRVIRPSASIDCVIARWRSASASSRFCCKRRR